MSLPTSSSGDIISPRRGSAASSVSVTIETTTTSAPADSATLDEPSSSSTIVPFGGRLSSLPTTPEEHPTATVTPLTFFFPFSTLTPVSSTFPPSSSLPPPVTSSPPTPPPPPPPSYAETPRTAAECIFWWGFLLPLCWIFGAVRLCRSERPASFAAAEKALDAEAAAMAQQELDVEAALSEAGVWSGHPAMGARQGRSAPSVEESMMLWREKERIWAKSVLGKI
ncbi:hypothetical protein JCM8547_000299 [Rhodosporidiobolus lusitaniae]